MAKDSIGNELKVGDLILFNGMLMTVTQIQDAGIIGASGSVQSGKLQGLMVPGQLMCSVAIQFDPSKPVGVFALQNPNPESPKDGKPN